MYDTGTVPWEPSPQALTRCKGDSPLFLSERCANPGRCGVWGEPIFKTEKLRLGLGLLEALACRSRRTPVPFPLRAVVRRSRGRPGEVVAQPEPGLWLKAAPQRPLAG